MAPPPTAVLESPLPASLPVGAATALFLVGSCDGDLEAILVDGVPHPPTATRMPRPDLAGAPYRSGWWATVPVPARAAPGRVELAARLAGNGPALGLGAVPVVAAPPRPGLPPGLPPAGSPLIAICLATYDPDLALLEVQLESIRGQDDADWVCVISDDGSPPAALAGIERLVDGDPRFVLHASSTRRGFYRNFERALQLVPAEASLVALSDHDDRWYPDKLAALRAAIDDPRTQLAYSDQRLVDPSGRVLRESLWTGRANNVDDLASMLVANSITGAATLFRAELLDRLLPFPDTPGLQFHDHWLALVALACGDLAYVDRPLYDYVQHPRAVFGDVTGTGPARRRRRPPAARRAAYFCGHLAREVQAQTLLIRCADRLAPAKRAVLERYVAVERSPAAAAWLAGRALRRLRGEDETLGGELELLDGLLWRWSVGPRAALGRRGRATAAFPDPLAFEQRRLRRWRASLAQPVPE